MRRQRCSRYHLRPSRGIGGWPKFGYCASLTAETTMTPERHEEIGRIFHDAIELRPDERAEFLRKVCAGDKELRKEVESLLALEEQAKDFIERPGWQVTAASSDDLSESDEDKMKFCPRCQRQYPSAQRFCTDDNQQLSLQDPYH